MTQEFSHVSVLLHESIDGLNIDPNGIYVDCTFGRGGHSREILSKLSAKGRLYSIDRDQEAIKIANQMDDPRFTIINGPFSKLADYVEEYQLAGKINGILMDLGVSSPQLDNPERGFSFSKDGPLDMRMDQSSGQSAADWLAQADESDIAWVLKTFGEERFSKRIARAIVENRLDVECEPLVRTGQLAALIAKAVPVKDKHKHPATRSFQGIRIYINSELEEIKQALQATTDALAINGRLVVISFHSLEDRLVKRFMRDESNGPEIPKGLPLTNAQIKELGSPKLKRIGKAIKPTCGEVDQNVRSRSSVLRIAERIAE